MTDEELNSYRNEVTRLIARAEKAEAALKRSKADALREAAAAFDRFDVVTIEPVDIGSNVVPISPADRLRDLADVLEGVES